MACCSLVYPRKVVNDCLLCGVEMCARCLAKHFKKHLDSLAMHKVAQNLLKKPAATEAYRA